MQQVAVNNAVKLICEPEPGPDVERTVNLREFIVLERKERPKSLCEACIHGGSCVLEAMLEKSRSQVRERLVSQVRSIAAGAHCRNASVAEALHEERVYPTNWESEVLVYRCQYWAPNPAE